MHPILAILAREAFYIVSRRDRRAARAYRDAIDSGSLARRHEDAEHSRYIDGRFTNSRSAN